MRIYERACPLSSTKFDTFSDPCIFVVIDSDKTKIIYGTSGVLWNKKFALLFAWSLWLFASVYSKPCMCVAALFLCKLLFQTKALERVGPVYGRCPLPMMQWSVTTNSSFQSSTAQLTLFEHRWPVLVRTRWVRFPSCQIWSVEVWRSPVWKNGP